MKNITKMLKLNQNVVIVAIGLFLVSFTALMFVLNFSDKHDGNELKTTVFGSSSPEHMEEKTVDIDYKKYTHNSEDPYLVLRNDGTIYHLSEGYRALEGFESGEIENKLFFTMIKMEDLVSFMASFGKALAREQEIGLVGPYRLKNNSGQYHYMVSSMYPIVTEGKVSLIIVTVKNISKDLDNKKESGSQQSEGSQEAKIYGPSQQIAFVNH